MNIVKLFLNKKNIIIFSNIFYYGIIFNILGYTQNNIAAYFNISSDKLQLILLTQFIGAILGCISLFWFLNKFNIKHVILFSLLGVFISLLLIFFNKNLICFILLTFFIGLFINILMPIITGYLSYENQNKNKEKIFLISSINGFYAFGASFMPLCFATLFLKINNHVDTNHWKYFYLIGAFLTLLIGIWPYFIFDVKYPFQQISTKIIYKNKKHKSNVHISNIFWQILILMIVMTGYRFILITFSFNFTIIQKTAINNISPITIIHAYGIFNLCFAIWAIISGIFLTWRWKIVNWLILNFILLIINTMVYILITHSYIKWMFVSISIFGILIGWMWQLIYILMINLDIKRTNFLTILIESIPVIGSPSGFLISWLILRTNHNNNFWKIILYIILGISTFLIINLIIYKCIHKKFYEKNKIKSAKFKYLNIKN